MITFGCLWIICQNNSTHSLTLKAFELDTKGALVCIISEANKENLHLWAQSEMLLQSKHPTLETKIV